MAKSTALPVALSIGLLAIGVLIGRFVWPRGATPGRPDIAAVPVIFIHGYAGKAESWIDRNYADAHATHKGFAWRGTLSVDRDGVVQLSAPPRQAEWSPARFPAYALALSNNGRNAIDASAEEVARAVGFAKKEHQAERVVLVGFSLGGVIARAYLVAHVDDHCVSQLITINSPHGGSELAYLYNLLKALGDLAAGREPDLTALQPMPTVLDPLIRTLAKVPRGNSVGTDLRRLLATWLADQLDEVSTKHGFMLHDAAVADVRPPAVLTGGKGNYLHRLNTSRHPADVEYWALTGKNNLLDLSAADFVDDLAVLDPESGGPAATERSGIVGVLTECARALLGGGTNGDGWVSLQSQGLDGVAYLRDNQIRVHTLQVDGTHMKPVLQQEVVPLVIRSGGASN